MHAQDSDRANDVGSAFLQEAREQLRGCRQLIAHCVGQLNDEQVWWRAGERFNSIANLLLHLQGNVGQRIGSLIGGQPDVRNRDREFAERGPIAKAELLRGFDATFEHADDVLAALAPQQLLETRRWRMLAGETEGTLIALVLQTLVHVSGHAQEIVVMTRRQLGETYRFLRS